MEKLKCEKCGKEIDYVDSCRISLENKTCRTDYYVLCEECFEKMEKWILEKTEEKYDEQIN